MRATTGPPDLEHAGLSRMLYVVQVINVGLKAHPTPFQESEKDDVVSLLRQIPANSRSSSYSEAATSAPALSPCLPSSHRRRRSATPVMPLLAEEAGNLVQIGVSMTPDGLV